MRTKGTGSVFQRCEARLGCPAMVAGPPHPRTGNPTRVRPAHRCKGMWVAVVELPMRGDERQRKTIVRAKKADAIRALRDARDQLDRVGDLSGTTPTLNAWIDEWWAKYAPEHIKVTQWPKYRTYFELYIKPPLGKKRLDRIDVAAIEQMHSYILNPPPAGLGLARTTAGGAHRILSSVLGYAVTREKIHRNVARIAKAPKVGKTLDRAHLGAPDARRVMATHDPGDGTVPQILAMLMTAFFIGPRPAELVGLTRDSIDVDSETITFSWQLQRIQPDHGCGDPSPAGEYQCGRRKAGYCPQKVTVIPEHTEARHVEGTLWLVRPKTEASWRRLPMPPPLTAMFRIFLTDLEPGIEGLVFTRPRGGKGKGAAMGRPISLEDWNKKWSSALAAAGIEYDPQPTPYSARHTCNTILMELEVPADVRILILGQAAVEVNERVYTHTSDPRVREALALMGQHMLGA